MGLASSHGGKLSTRDEIGCCARTLSARESSASFRCSARLPQPAAPDPRPPTPVPETRASLWPRAARLFLAVLGIASAVAASEPPAAFDFDHVAAKAHRLAQEPFHDPRGEVPDWLLKLSYDQWRDIRFRADKALWADAKLPFQVQFFHPGLYYDRTVTINVVDGGSVKPIPFAAADFDYGKNDFGPRVPAGLGFAGFRLHAPIKTRNYYDEVIVFLGASYFRAVGNRQVFGLSARGLAIDTGERSGEQFPYFREFWLVKPTPKDTSMKIYGLLDSPSLAGAYEFVVTPGEQTVVKVALRLFLRDEVDKLGVAPLTSMFFHGENTSRAVADFRPEAHDSDGLLLNLLSGEWLWRPLDNPRSLQISSFQMRDPRGFGLLQRDREFEHYQDLETRAELRPSVWVEPEGEWGEGRIELVEIPSENDINDNIVAYWVPRTSPKPGPPVRYAYTLYWFGDDASRPLSARAIATRRDRGRGEGVYRFVIDFSGKSLNAIAADRVLRGVVSVAAGEEAAELIDQQVVKNPLTGTWRLIFQVRPKGRAPVELRAYLEQGGKALTETWSYALQP